METDGMVWDFMIDTNMIINQPFHTGEGSSKCLTVS